MEGNVFVTVNYGVSSYRIEYLDIYKNNVIEEEKEHLKGALYGRYLFLFLRRDRTTSFVAWKTLLVQRDNGLNECIILIIEARE